MNERDAFSSETSIRPVKNVPSIIIDGKNKNFPEDWGTLKNIEYFGFNPANGYFVRSMWQCDCTFCEKFELESFPFDHQNLTIFIQSARDINSVDLIPMPRFYNRSDLNNISHNNCAPIEFFSNDSIVDEWEFTNLVCEFGYSKKSSSRQKKQYPMIVIQIKALRSFVT